MSPANKPQSLPKKIVRFVLALIFIAAFISVASTFFTQPPATEGAPKTAAAPGKKDKGMVMPVASATAQTQDIRVTLDALGTVTAPADITIKTQIAGELQKVAFQEGQVVKAGDFLAQIDPRPYEHALTEAEGQLQKDQALLKDAQLTLSRYQKLIEEDSISRQQLDTQDALVQEYEGTVKADTAQVATAKLNLAYCHVTAPVSGRVGIRSVDEGTYVQVAATLTTVAQMQPMTVLFTLPEDKLSIVRKNLKINPSLDVTAYDRNQKQPLASGHVVSMDNRIDATTGTFKLRAAFDNKDESLFPNQFVNISLLVETLSGATVIPVSAVQRGSQGSYVYVIGDDLTVTARPIKVGQIDGERLQILEGLQAGERVVSDGADKLHDGASVTLPAEVKDGADKPKK